jgi:hypothetical protein
MAYNRLGGDGADRVAQTGRAILLLLGSAGQIP